MRDLSEQRAMIRLPNQKIAAFTNAVPLSHMHRRTVLVQRRPLQPRNVRYRKKARAATPILCVQNKDYENVKRGLTITREEVLQRTRRGRTARLRRWATQSEIDIPGGGDTRVDVWLVIARDRRDYRVRAKVVSEMVRSCDRCAREYVAECDGRFDVVLRSGDAKSEEEEAEVVEEVEEFGPGVAEVWLGDHARDGVYLGVPTRSLCNENCGGVEVRIAPGGGSVRYSCEDGRSDVDDGLDTGGELGRREAGEKLMELKRQLEKEGL